MGTLIGIISAIIFFLLSLFEIISKVKEAIEVSRDLKGFFEGREARENEKIRFVLFSEGEEWVLPYSPRRKELSRAEVAGAIGLFSGGKRFSLPRLSEIFLDGSYDAVISGSSSELRIPCPVEQIEAFKAFAKSL